MVVFEERNRMYEEDPNEKEARNIFDDIDIQRMEYESGEYTSELELEVEEMFWEDDVKECLHEIGIDYDYSLDNVPKDRIQRIYEHYYNQSKEMNDRGEYIDVDPIPEYYAGNGSSIEELFKLGYTLGNIGVVGCYYKLLVDINFARGFWLGKFEKAINEDNDQIILDVSKDMKIFDPETAEKELTDIVNKCFSENTQESTEENSKKI